MRIARHRVLRLVLAACLPLAPLVAGAGSAAGILIDPADIDVGVVRAGSGPVTVEAALTNPGGGPLELMVKASCGCTGIEPAALRLGAGQSERLRISLAATPGKPDLGAIVYLLEKGSGTELGRINLRGKVAPWLLPESPVGQIEIVGANTTLPWAAKFTNRIEEAFEGKVEVEGAIAEFLTPIKPRIAIASQSAESIPFTVRSPGERRVRGKLNLIAAGQETPVATMDVVLTGLSPYVAKPAAIIVQGGADGTPISREVIIQRRDERPFRIVAARYSPELGNAQAIIASRGEQTEHSISVRLPSAIASKRVAGTLVLETSLGDTIPIRILSRGGGG